MTSITNQTLREKLSLGLQKHRTDVKNHLINIETTMNNVFKKSLKEQAKYHTVDYADKKASQYKNKYQIDIKRCMYQFDIIDTETKALIQKHLNTNNKTPVGFYAYHKTAKHHVDGFIIYDKKILVLQSSLSSDEIIDVLKNNFSHDKIYVQQKIEREKTDWDTDDEIHYNHPQNDGISCPVFALKYLKECLRDDAKLLSMTQFMPTDKTFILHPAIERYSQSDDYYTQAKQNWQKNYQSKESDALLAKADDWRNTHDKTRMIY